MPNKILVVSTDNIQNMNIRSPLLKLLSKKFNQVLSVGDRKSGLQEEIIWSGAMARNGFIGEFIVLFRFARILYDQEPSHIISFSPKGNIYTGFLSFFFKYKHIAVITGLGKYANFFSSNNKLIILLLRLIYSKTKLIITMNNNNYNFFKSITNVHIEKINSEGYQPPINLGPRKHFDGSKFNILYLSRIIEEKGILVLLEAISKVISSGRDVRLNIAGDMGLSQSGQNIFNGYIDNVRIIYMGKVSEQRKNQLFMESELYILPSIYGEGLPMSLLEAQYLGCMVLTTQVAGCIDALAPGNQGNIVNYSSDAIAIKINEIFDSFVKNAMNPRYFELRQESKKWVIDNHLISKIMQDYSRIFEETKVFE